MKEIIEHLKAAQAERSAAHAKELLEIAANLCEKREDAEEARTAAIYKAQILAELAYEEDSPTVRSTRWRDALKTLKSQWDKSPSDNVAETYAFVAVDCFQDTFSALELEERQNNLRIAKSYIDDCLQSDSKSGESAVLLARKSSLLRHQSIGELSTQSRVSRLDESLRCAKRAVTQRRDRGTLLELALSEWARARHERTDEGYASKIRDAEKHMGTSKNGFPRSQSGRIRAT